MGLGESAGPLSPEPPPGQTDPRTTPALHKQALRPQGKSLPASHPLCSGVLRTRGLRSPFLENTKPEVCQNVRITGARIACWYKSAGLVIERLRVRIPAGAAGEFSSPELALCADYYSVSIPPSCYRSGTLKNPTVLPKVQLAGYT